MGPPGSLVGCGYKSAAGTHYFLENAPTPYHLTLFHLIHHRFIEQGGNVPLYLPEHVLGRAQQGPFQYTSLAVSACHCTLRRTSNASGESDVFLSDSRSDHSTAALCRSRSRCRRAALSELHCAPTVPTALSSTLTAWKRTVRPSACSMGTSSRWSRCRKRVTMSPQPTHQHAGSFKPVGAVPGAANAFAYVFVSHAGHKRKAASQGETALGAEGSPRR